MAIYQQTQAPSHSPAPADEKSHISGAKAIFWDIEDYKIPDGLNAGEVSKNIKTDIADMGHRGAVSISAYADEANPVQDDVFHSAGIKLERISGGSDARDKAILTHMLCTIFEKESATIVLISDSIYTTGKSRCVLEKPIS